MQTCRVEATVSGSGTLTIKGLPFPEGDKVEVIVCSRKRERKSIERYPLRGQPIRYVDPFGSVAEDNWSVLQ